MTKKRWDIRKGDFKKIGLEKKKEWMKNKLFNICES